MQKVSGPSGPLSVVFQECSSLVLKNRPKKMCSVVYLMEIESSASQICVFVAQISSPSFAAVCWGPLQQHLTASENPSSKLKPLT